mgnify:CR=1 FL=1
MLPPIHPPTIGTSPFQNPSVIKSTVFDSSIIPKTITKITVEEVFLHCGKAPLRGSLWKPESWPAGRPIPNLNQIIKDHAEDNETPQMTDTEIEIKDQETLY